MLQNETIYIPEIIPHMHYLGRGMTVTIKKSGSDKAEVVLDVQNYNYENPAPVTFDPPLEISPGDEINVTCIFFSVNKDTYTYFGLATSDEMCLAITTYYPQKPTIGDCFGAGGSAFCGDLQVNQGKVNQCFTSKFFNNTYFLGDLLYTYCDTSGLVCREECKPVLANITASYPECFNDDVRPFLIVIANEREPGALGFLQALLSCDPKPGLGNIADDDGNTIDECYPPASSGPIVKAVDNLAVMVFIVLITQLL
jgi:hypothetical protein